VFDSLMPGIWRIFEWVIAFCAVAVTVSMIMSRLRHRH